MSALLSILHELLVVLLFNSFVFV